MSNAAIAPARQEEFFQVLEFQENQASLRWYESLSTVQNVDTGKLFPMADETYEKCGYTTMGVNQPTLPINFTINL